MEKLTLADVKNIYEYEKIRPQWRRHVIEIKARRRIVLGDRASMVFENRETVLNQIQEMMRAERIVDDEKVAEEIEVYNELIPEAGELSGTLFIEIPELHLIQQELDRLLGIDECVWIEVGEHRIRGQFDPRQSREDRISAVHYIKFPFTDEAVEALRRGEPARVVIAHPNYQAAAEINGALREELLHDLAS